MLELVRDSDATDDDLSDADLDALSRKVAILKRLMNDPVALMARAKGLLEGTALPVLGWSPLLIGVGRLLVSIACVALASVNLPGTNLDDIARQALQGGSIPWPSLDLLLGPLSGPSEVAEVQVPWSAA